MLNTISLIGRLTKDVETRSTKEGGKIANFTLAIPNGVDSAMFIDCVAFNKVAEVVETYTSKGGKLAVSGRLSVENYTRKDGSKGTAVKVLVNDVELIDIVKPEEKPEEKPVEKKTAKKTKKDNEVSDLPF